ncbi:MAG: hypothetical protein FJZ07_00820 [Candidatus Nealsonbacteria bacterium]|nr:hypothetical protein [Candidatus Nealsonbacteria bacterium]
MKQSELFYKTLKEAPRETKTLSNILLTRAGFIDQVGAGLYAFLPLGFKVLKKIEDIIRQEMLNIGGQEILMPALGPKKNWQKTGRWESFDTLFKLEEYALAPTHEEIISPLAKKVVLSYKDLPFYLFQIQTKFRNELRVKSGLLRTREFLMKDLYSFHKDEKELNQYYEKVARAYFKIFKRCGVKSYKTLASGGTFSKYSHEYQVLTEAGEDVLYLCSRCDFAINQEVKKDFEKCPKCDCSEFYKEKGVEVGNIFKLGDKYSLPFELKFRNKNGKEKPVIMGCYGIGLPRLMAAIVEHNHDEKGIVWPEEVAPFAVHLLKIKNQKAKSKNQADKIYHSLQKSGTEVLYDDREDVSPGEKFTEADLIGIPARLVVSEKTLKSNCLEVKKRAKKESKLVKINSLC